MNEKAIVKHFAAKWAGDAAYRASRTEEHYLVTDGYALLRLPCEHLLFDSRRMFPTFPGEGETLVYQRGTDPVEWETNLASVLSRWAHAPQLVETVPTEWLRENGSALVRVFETTDKQKVFVDESLASLLRGKDETLDMYRFSAEPPGEDNPKIPVIVCDADGEIIAALQPMVIIKQATLFADEAEAPRAALISDRVMRAAKALIPWDLDTDASQ